jgi:hypothetical protein
LRPELPGDCFHIVGRKGGANQDHLPWSHGPRSTGRAKQHRIRLRGVNHADDQNAVFSQQGRRRMRAVGPLCTGLQGQLLSVRINVACHDGPGLVTKTAHHAAAHVA